MLNILVKAERCAINGYTAICNYTAGQDHRTHDLALAILHEEVPSGGLASAARPGCLPESMVLRSREAADIGARVFASLPTPIFYLSHRENFA